MGCSPFCIFPHRSLVNKLVKGDCHNDMYLLFVCSSFIFLYHNFCLEMPDLVLEVFLSNLNKMSTNASHNLFFS